jgi:hypothetical protein
MRDLRYSQRTFWRLKLLDICRINLTIQRTREHGYMTSQIICTAMMIFTNSQFVIAITSGAHIVSFPVGTRSQWGSFIDINKNGKVYCRLKCTYFPNLFFTVLHTLLALIFVYCWWISCSRTIEIYFIVFFNVSCYWFKFFIGNLSEIGWSPLLQHSSLPHLLPLIWHSNYIWIGPCMRPVRKVRGPTLLLQVRT